MLHGQGLGVRLVLVAVAMHLLAWPVAAQNKGYEWYSEFQLDAMGMQWELLHYLYDGPPASGWEAFESEYATRIISHRDAGLALARDELLWQCARASLNTRLGNWRDVEQGLLWTAEVMDNRRELPGDVRRRQQAAAGQERAKTWRGEPYERAMANFYVGFAAYMREDFDTAVVAFRRSLAADAASQEHYTDDLRLSHYFLAKALLGRDGPSAGNIDVALEKAARYVTDRKGVVPLHGTQVGSIEAAARRPRGETQTRRKKLRGKAGVVHEVQSPFLSRDTIEQANLTVLVAAGRAPLKTIAGYQGQGDKILPPVQEVATIEVFVDGVFVAETLPLVNLYHQAMTRGRSGKDAAQAGKAIGKTVALTTLSLIPVVGLSADVIQKTWDIYGDTRTWHLLPNELHLFTGRVSPGLHRIELRARDAEGQELPRHMQRWNCVPVSAGREQVLYLEMLPDRSNVFDQRVLLPVRSYNARKREVTFQTSPLIQSDQTLSVGDMVEVVSLPARPKRERTPERTDPILRRLPARVTKVEKRRARAELLEEPAEKITKRDRVVFPLGPLPVGAQEPILLAAAPAPGAESLEPMFATDADPGVVGLQGGRPAAPPNTTLVAPAEAAPSVGPAGLESVRAVPAVEPLGEAEQEVFDLEPIAPAAPAVEAARASAERPVPPAPTLVETPPNEVYADIPPPTPEAALADRTPAEPVAPLPRVERAAAPTPAPAAETARKSVSAAPVSPVRHTAEAQAERAAPPAPIMVETPPMDVYAPAPASSARGPVDTGVAPAPAPTPAPPVQLVTPAPPAAAPAFRGEVEQIQVPNVSLIQVHLALSKAGFGAAREWGKYGSYTTKQVKAFQYEHDLRETGVIDAPTWARLRTYDRPGVPR